MPDLPGDLERELLQDPSFQRAVARRVQAKRQAEARAAKVPPFESWLRDRWHPPEWRWDWAHLEVIQEALDRVTRGEIDRLGIFVPPRHGKTELVTIRYAAWRINRDPRCRVLLGAYSASLATKFSRQARDILTAEAGIDLEKDTEVEWETEAGGGIYAVGVGGGITGRGGDLIIVDDPVKSRAEAHSEVYRRKVSGWYHTDLWTRQEPGCAIILIMTRWDPEDLGGAVLAGSEGSRWTILRMPGLAETQEERDHYWRSIDREDLVGQPDPLGRMPGEPLCPDRYDGDWYEQAQGVMGLDFEAVVMQRPTPPEGGMFKRAWFEIVPERQRPLASVRYWDKAGSLGTSACSTAGVRLDALPGNIVVISDLVMGKWEAAEREQVIDQVAAIDGPGVVVVTEQEGGSGGKESAENTVRRLVLRGHIAYADRVSGAGSKVQRAEPLATLAANGGVKMVRAPWNNTLLDIFAAFPHGIKDPVDAASGALSWLRQVGPVKIEDNPFYS